MPAFRDYFYAKHGRGDFDVPYEISDQDDAGTVQYFGFLNNQGGWIIQQYDTGASPKTMRYAIGTSSYSANWTARASLSYGYYNTLFVQAP